MINRDQYEALKRRFEQFEIWRAGRTSYPADSVPKLLEVTNEERSEMEVYEFVTDPPEKYFLYCSFSKDAKNNEFTHYGASGFATTWTGQKLGNIQCGHTWRSNWGDTRVSIRVYGINGVTYAGTYFKSSGNYARVKRVKN